MIIAATNTNKYIFNSKNAGRMPRVICSQLGRISERKIGSEMGLTNVCYDPKQKIMTFNILDKYTERIERFITKLINNQNSRKKVKPQKQPENVVPFRNRPDLKSRYSLYL
jgi:hypothetical protein